MIPVDLKLQRAGFVILVALVTLGALIGIQLTWKRFVLDQPVAAKLAAVQGVSKVTMGSNSNIEVSLKSVPNLKATCSELLEAAGNSRLILKDNRSPALQALLDKVRFGVEEALVQGDFTAMQKEFYAAAKEAKLDSYGVYMDSDYIYLQFQQGDKYLYQVFPRQQGKSLISTDG